MRLIGFITQHAEQIADFNDLVGIAADHARNGRHASALAAYETLVRHPAAPPSTHYDHAVVLRALGRHRDALAALTRFLAQEPGSFAGWTNAGDSARELGAHGEALAFFSRALHIAPAGKDNAARAHHNLSRQLVGEDFTRAMFHAEAAAALAPDDPECVVGLAELQLMDGDYVRGWRNYAARSALAEYS